MALLEFLQRSPKKKHCTRCGARAAHGYSEFAKSDPKQIAPLCLGCLITELRKDYTEFRGRAIVAAPAIGLPCYVFRDLSYLRDGPSPMSSDFEMLLHQIHTCAECRKAANSLWLESRGLSIESFGRVVELGPQKTPLSWGNPAPVSLCGACTVQRISRKLEHEEFEFFEVCAPHRDQQGIVIPMAY